MQYLLITCNLYSCFFSLYEIKTENDENQCIFNSRMWHQSQNQMNQHRCIEKTFKTAVLTVNNVICYQSVVSSWYPNHVPTQTTDNALKVTKNFQRIYIK